MSLPLGADLLFGEMTCTEKKKNVTNTLQLWLEFREGWNVGFMEGQGSCWTGWKGTISGLSALRGRAVCLFNLLAAVSPTLSTCLAH